MRFYSIMALMLLASTSLHAQIYKWTDSSGVVHFSDIPHEGAEKITVPVAQTYAPAATPPADNSSSNKPDEASDTYNNIAVTEPKDQSTIRNNQGFVPIMVSISPNLKPGNLLQIIYDGNALGKPQSSMAFALNDVARGTHTIAVQVVDADGAVLLTSDPITIFMHRAQKGMVHGALSKSSGTS